MQGSLQLSDSCRPRGFRKEGDSIESPFLCSKAAQLLSTAKVFVLTHVNASRQIHFCATVQAFRQKDRSMLVVFGKVMRTHSPTSMQPIPPQCRLRHRMHSGSHRNHTVQYAPQVHSEEEGAAWMRAPHERAKKSSPARFPSSLARSALLHSVICDLLRTREHPSERDRSDECVCVVLIRSRKRESDRCGKP